MKTTVKNRKEINMRMLQKHILKTYILFYRFECEFKLNICVQREKKEDENHNLKIVRREHKFQN